MKTALFASSLLWSNLLNLCVRMAALINQTNPVHIQFEWFKNVVGVLF